MSMVDAVAQILSERFEYGATAALIALGTYGLLVKRNLVKKLIALNILQTAIILLFISMSLRPGGTVPIIEPGRESAAVVYMSPLPHVLMLTAIVVMVGTAGVAFALLIRIYQRYGTLEEDELLERGR
jgi:multicomponent Na+:H+ antiporter subunit C